MSAGDPLVGENVFKHIRHVSDLKDRTHWHFRCKSKLWKAIVDHIWHADEVVLAPKPSSSDTEVVVHRGTGPAISLKDVGVWGQDIQEGKDAAGKFTGYICREVAFWIKFEVTWYSEEYGEEITRDYSLDRIPCDLELNFTKEKFDKWVKSFAQDRMASGLTRQLTELIEKLPECPERKRIDAELDKIRNKFRIDIDLVE